MSSVRASRVTLSCSEDSSLPSDGLGSAGKVGKGGGGVAVAGVGKVGVGASRASCSEDSSLPSNRLGSAGKVGKGGGGVGVSWSELPSRPVMLSAEVICSWMSLNCSIVMLPNPHRHVADSIDKTAPVALVYFNEGKKATSNLPNSLPNTADNPAIFAAIPLPDTSLNQHTWATLWNRAEPVILTVSKGIRKAVVVANGSKSKPVANSKSPTKHTGRRLYLGNLIANRRAMSEYTQVPGRWIKSHIKSSGCSSHTQFLVSSHTVLLVCCLHELFFIPASVSSHDFILHIWITKPVCWAKSFWEEATIDAPNFVARNPVMTVTKRLNRQHLETSILHCFNVTFGQQWPSYTFQVFTWICNTTSDVGNNLPWAQWFGIGVSTRDEASRGVKSGADSSCRSAPRPSV